MNGRFWNDLKGRNNLCPLIAVFSPTVVVDRSQQNKKIKKKNLMEVNLINMHAPQS